MQAKTNTVVYGQDIQSRKAIAVEIADLRIASIKEIPFDASLPFLSSGWIDLQVNGYYGYDINSDDFCCQDLLEITKHLYARGVTGYLPTVITGSFARMRKAMQEIAEAKNTDSKSKRSIAGIHMEGPWISALDGPRGAHELEHVRDGSIAEFEALQEAAEGNILKVTLAPERNGAIALISYLVKQGIKVAIGHSNASREDILAAVDAGASISTHLGNGAHPTLPRHHNYIWEQLAEDRLFAGLIADGHHLPKAVLQSMLRCKREKAFVVSDCISLAGLEPSDLPKEVQEQVIFYENGRIALRESPEILAGSSASLLENAEFLLRALRLPLAESVSLLTDRPAMAMDWLDRGRLSLGQIADITSFHWNGEQVQIEETFVCGQSVYKRKNL